MFIVIPKFFVCNCCVCVLLNSSYVGVIKFHRISFTQEPGKFHGQMSLAGYSSWSNQGAGHDLVTKQQKHLAFSVWNLMSSCFRKFSCMLFVLFLEKIIIPPFLFVYLFFSFKNFRWLDIESLKWSSYLLIFSFLISIYLNSCLAFLKAHLISRE